MTPGIIFSDEVWIRLGPWCTEMGYHWQACFEIDTHQHWVHFQAFDLGYINSQIQAQGRVAIYLCISLVSFSTPVFVLLRLKRPPLCAQIRPVRSLGRPAF